MLCKTYLYFGASIFCLTPLLSILDSSEHLANMKRKYRWAKHEDKFAHIMIQRRVAAFCVLATDCSVLVENWINNLQI